MFTEEQVIAILGKQEAGGKGWFVPQHGRRRDIRQPSLTTFHN